MRIATNKNTRHTTIKTKTGNYTNATHAEKKDTGQKIVDKIDKTVTDTVTGAVERSDSITRMYDYPQN